MRASASELGGAQVKEPGHPGLHQPGSTFVTLTRQGELRGCVGSLEAFRPLDQDVRENARAAAFRDRRFAPLLEGELSATRVEVSLLARPEPIRFATEEDAVRQLRQGIDGVILESERHRGAFLPQMWERLPDPRQFMSELRRKAGLAEDFWSKDLRLRGSEMVRVKEGGDFEGPGVVDARWWRPLADGRIQCDLCPRDCRAARRQSAASASSAPCIRALMVLTTYGRSSGFCIDPIEKKPLNHFYPRGTHPAAGSLARGAFPTNL